MANHKANPPEDWITTTIRVRKVAFDRFREICAAEHLTPRQEIRRLIDRRIAEYDDGEEAA